MAKRATMERMFVACMLSISKLLVFKDSKKDVSLNVGIFLLAGY